MIIIDVFAFDRLLGVICRFTLVINILTIVTRGDLYHPPKTLD